MQVLPDDPAEASKKWNVIFSKIENDARRPFSNELARLFAFSEEECERVLSNIPLIFLKGVSKANAEQFKNEWKAPGVEILLLSQDEEKEKSVQILWSEPEFFYGRFFDEVRPSDIRVGNCPPGTKRLNQAITKLSERFEEIIRDTGAAEEFKEFFNVLAQILREVADKEQEQREKNQIVLMKLRAEEALRQKALFEFSQKTRESERVKEAFNREILDIKQMFEKAAEDNQALEDKLKQLESELEKRIGEAVSGGKREQNEKSELKSRKANEAVKLLEGQIQGIREKLEASEAEKQDLEMQLKIRSDEVRAAKEKQQQAEAAAQESLERLSLQSGDAGKENYELNEALKLLESQSGAVKERLQASVVENQGLEKQLKESAAQAEEMEVKNRELQIALKSLEASHANDFPEQARRFEQLNEKHAHEKKILEIQIQELKEKGDDNESQKQALEEQLQKSLEEKEGADESLRQTEAELKNLKAEQERQRLAKASLGQETEDSEAAAEPKERKQGSLLEQALRKVAQNKQEKNKERETAGDRKPESEAQEKSLLEKKIRTLEENLEKVETEKKKVEADHQKNLQEAREAAEMICMHLQKKADEDAYKMRKEMEEKMAELERTLKKERSRTMEIQQKNDEIQKMLDEAQNKKN